MPDRIPPFPDPKPNLVVVRAGAQSLHPGWLDLRHDDRSWDLVVSYFNPEAYAAHTPQAGVQKVLIKGGKWDGLFKTFDRIDGHESYQRIWLPDDDIASNGADVNAMFAQAETYNLAVCQPSLTLDSYFSHFMFLSCQGFRLRYTNYIEIMVPCLTREIFDQVLPLFENTMSGYGLDYIWCRLPGAGRFKTAVLDDVAMHHTRPIGTQLRGTIADQKGGRAEDEEALLLARFGGIKKAVPVAYGGIKADGTPVEGRLSMAFNMHKGYRNTLDQCLEPAYASRKTRQLFKRQLIKPMSLELLRPETHHG